MKEYYKTIAAALLFSDNCPKEDVKWCLFFETKFQNEAFNVFLVRVVC